MVPNVNAVKIIKHNLFSATWHLSSSSAVVILSALLYQSLFLLCCLSVYSLSLSFLACGCFNCLGFLYFLFTAIWQLSMNEGTNEHVFHCIKLIIKLIPF